MRRRECLFATRATRSNDASAARAHHDQRYPEYSSDEHKDKEQPVELEETE